MKKCFSLVLIVLMLLASVNVSATEVSSIDIMTNGNFEGDSSGWDSGGKVGYGLSRDYSRSPLYSYKVTYDPDVVNTNQALTVRYFDAIPGATYEFSAWSYIASTLPSDSKPGFSATFMDENNTTVGKGFSYQYKDIVPGQWCEGTNSAVAPEGATKVRIMLRLYNNSNTTENAVCYFDDTSFIVSGSGDIITSYIQDMEYQRQLAKESQDSYDAQLAKINATEFEDGAENLIPNPDFENGSDYTPANWGSYANGVWGTSLIRTNETAYSGSYSVKIDTTADGNQKGVAQTIFSGFEPGRKYLFQSKVKVKSYTRGDGASLKILPLASTSGGLYNYLDGANSGNFIWEYEDPDGKYWHDLKCVVDLPEETACVVVYLVVQGQCEIYFDDVKFALAKGENHFTLSPERTFFYLDNEFGSVFADFNSAFEIAEGSTVEFTLSDGETILDSATLPATELTEWKFNLNKIPSMLTKYTVKATYRDPNGTQIGETLSENVYKTTRPYCLDKDGNYIDENGEYFYPLIGYGASSGFKTEGYADRAAAKLDELKENHETNGINVYAMPIYGSDWAQGSAYAIEKIRTVLDEAQEKGYKYFYTLGSGVPSAYPNGTYERTELILQNFANHPAIFAWSVMDEVSLKIKNNGTFKTYDYMKEWLEKSYIQIRKYDQSKPIYILDTGRQEYMEKTSRISDIFANDPYPASRADTVMQTYTKTKWSTGGTNGTTPVAIIAQMTSNYGNTWTPTITEVRHQFYQAFWGGAKMVGFFSITGASDMVEELFTDPEGREADWMNFAQNEKDLIYEHFTTDKTLLITNKQEDDVWYRMWRASDNNIYLALMNMKHSGKTVDANTVTAEINLVSDNGQLSIDGYTAELISGDETTLLTSDADDNVFSATLPLTTVAFYKITPKTELDFSVVEDNASSVPEETTLDIECDGVSIESKTVTYGDDSFTLNAKTNGSENPLWSVESGDCVSVNAFSGEVTIKKGGTAVIKAAVASAYDTIEITVNKKEITAVTLVSTGIAERAYNGSKSVDTWTIPPTYTLTGAIAGDDVTLGGKYEFDNSGEGTDKPISLSDIILTGTNAEGYVLVDSIPLYMNNVGTGTITEYQGSVPSIPVSIESSKITDTKYSYSFYTDSGLNYESIVYIVYYDEYDNLLGINTTPLNLVSYNSVVLDIEFNPLYPTAEKIKLFVWSDTMKPLSNTHLTHK